MACCRICLKPTSGNRGRRPVMTDIFKAKFGPEPSSPRLVDLFTQCTAVECTRSDGLPSCICQTCVQQLLATYEFRQTSRRSDRKLRAAAPRKQSTTTEVKAESMTEAEPDDENGEVDFLDEDDSIAFDRMSVVESVKEDDDEDDDDNVCIAVLRGLTSLRKDDDIDGNGFIANEYDIIESPARNTTIVNIKSPPSSRQASPQHQPAAPDSCHSTEQPPPSPSWPEPKQRTTALPKNIKCYNCQTCQQTFAKLSLLRAHQRTEHALETTHLCAICGKACKTRGALIQHMPTHTAKEEGRFRCAHCPNRFGGKPHLLKHLQAVHFKLKPHQCPQCQRCFALKCSMTQHVKQIHLGLRPHACGSCPKTFKRASVLRKHELTHTGEKPYACEHCPQAFAQSNDLVKHRRQHWGTDRTYRCLGCGEAFRLLRELQELRQRDHFDRTGEWPEMEGVPKRSRAAAVVS